MPWTFAHPAAVLPLRRYCPRHLSFPALVVGSLTPDLGYYVPGAEFATHAHSFSGSVLICLPLGLMVLAVLCLLRKPLCYVLPQPHRAALMPLSEVPVTLTLSRLIKVAVSLVLGACTHIIWDAFTHKRDLIGLHIEALQAPLFNVGATGVPVYYLTQWLSTLAGTAILLIAYRRWLRRASTSLRHVATHEDRWRRALLIAIAAIALVIAVPLALDVAARFNGAFAAAVMMRCIAVFGTVAFALLVCASAVCCYWRRAGWIRRGEWP